MSTDTSIVFNIDKTLIEKTLTKTDVKKVSGQTVILKPTIDKKQPQLRLHLEAMSARKSRRQLAEELKTNEPLYNRKNSYTRTVDFKIVPFSLRLGAGILDCFFLALCVAMLLTFFQTSMIALNFYVMSKMASTHYQFADLIYFIGALLPSYLLVFVLPGLIFCASPGKIFFGLRVVRNDYFRPNFLQIFLREILRPLSLISIVGVLMGTIKPYRMFHDWLTGTTLKRF